MNRLKIEYFFNAVLYCIWRMHLSFYNIVSNVRDILLWPIYKLIFPLYSYKRKRMIAKETKKALDFINDKKYGLQIDKAKRDISFLFLPYCVCLSSNIISWANNIFDLSQTLSPIIYLGITSIMFFFYDNLLTKYIYFEDRYLYYFEIFETENKRWYRKWKWITIALGLGGWALIFITGFVYYILHPE